MTKQQLYDKIAYSPVYLEEDLHVYVHKDTGEVFNSVTSALNLVKNKFDKDGMSQNIAKQHTKLLKWFRKVGGRDSDIKEFFFLYLNYNKFRPYEAKTFNGKTFNSYKELSKYGSLNDLMFELKNIQKGFGIRRPPLKTIYLNTDNTVMTTDQILKIWDEGNLLSRHYGHLIHESIEDYILTLQGINNFDERKEKIKRIQAKFNELNGLLNSIDAGYNQLFFDQYKIDMVPLDFVQFIIHKFKQVQPDLGYFTVPEKVMYSPKYKITGTCDMDIVQNIKLFDIGDHKTNKRFSHDSEYGANLKYPFEHMPDCDASTYQLQLNVYGHIQEDEYDREFGKAWITHYDRENQLFQLIDIPKDLGKAKMLLEYQYEYYMTRQEKFLTSGILDGCDPRYYNYLTKQLIESIDYRTKLGLIDNSNKAENRIFYQNFVNEHTLKLKKAIAA